MLRHTPYDGSAGPFSIGLRPLDPADWIEGGGDLLAQLAGKERLLAADRETVFRAGSGTGAAQRGVLEMLAGHLTERFPDTYDRDGDDMTIRGRRLPVDLASSDPPLMTAARLVAEDLCLMRRHDDGWRLAAAALCFPSKWSLAEKIGRPMAEIHAPVPRFAGRMAAVVGRIFDNLAVERPVWRANWSLYGDDRLHHPEPHQPRALTRNGRVDPHALFVRVERQTLRRMPASPDILFTIRIHVDPLSRVLDDPRGPALAAGLARQLRDHDAAMLAYKGLATDRDTILAFLDEFAANALAGSRSGLSDASAIG